jgi:hypothetical protein
MEKIGGPGEASELRHGDKGPHLPEADFHSKII